MICPYCKNEAKYCENKEIYGRNFGKSYMCYFCRPCNAYVGTHQNSTIPLGTMANKELRGWRIRTHRAIDAYWKARLCSRGRMYALLRDIFGKVVHVGESDIEMCQKIIKATENKIPEMLKNKT